jgi:excisionase family DNA binding protein
MTKITFEELPTAFGYLVDKIESIEKLLQDRPQQMPPQDQLVTIQEAAEFLKLSVPTLYRLVSHSTIPVNKKGKRLYFSLMDLTHWVKQGRRKTLEEIQSDNDHYLTQKKGGLK